MIEFISYRLFWTVSVSETMPTYQPRHVVIAEVRDDIFKCIIEQREEMKLLPPSQQARYVKRFKDLRRRLHLELKLPNSRFRLEHLKHMRSEMNHMSHQQFARDLPKFSSCHMGGHCSFFQWKTNECLE